MPPPRIGGKRLLCTQHHAQTARIGIGLGLHRGSYARLLLSEWSSAWRRAPATQHRALQHEEDGGAGDHHQHCRQGGEGDDGVDAERRLAGVGGGQGRGLGEVDDLAALGDRPPPGAERREALEELGDPVAGGAAQLGPLGLGAGLEEVGEPVVGDAEPGEGRTKQQDGCGNPSAVQKMNCV